MFKPFHLCKAVIFIIPCKYYYPSITCGITNVCDLRKVTKEISSRRDIQAEDFIIHSSICNHYALLSTVNLPTLLTKLSIQHTKLLKMKIQHKKADMPTAEQRLK